MSTSKFSISKSFIAYENVTAEELRQQLTQSHQTATGVFALCVEGGLKLTINFTNYRIGPNTLIVIPPETFIQLSMASEDLRLHVVVFSQQLIHDAFMGKSMMDKFHIIGEHFVLPLPKVTFQLYRGTFTVLAHMYKTVSQQISPNVLENLLHLMLQGISELCPEHARIKETPGSKHFQQYRLFVRLVHADYTRQHQMSYYAKEMQTTPSALCRIVKKRSRMYSYGNHQRCSHR
ncbi:MAG: AraC family ligand binding domain-containing protein [Bacteroides sp.]|nr:AraC family ligand binding domain-containing protein [Bacteroides sp.]